MGYFCRGVLPKIYMNRDSKIYVAGANTLLGSALLRILPQQGYSNLLDDGGLNLTHVREVEQFLADLSPEYVFVAAGKSGGISANQKYPASLMWDNLAIICNLTKICHTYNVQKLLYLASSCSYPRLSTQPMHPDSILTGPLEPTNEPYAVAKIAGIKLCESFQREYGVNFISAIPANSFGPGDDFSLENSHVISALMRRMHDAKEENAESVEIWGTGNPRREFVFIDDLAEACIYAMLHYDGLAPLNLGGGIDISIRELAYAIRDVVGYKGTLWFNSERPDGMPIKILDAERLLALGWQPKTEFRDALVKTYEWFLGNQTNDE